jgi:agmatinase
MRDTYLDEKYSHATVLRRIHELKPKEIIQLGIRSAELEEFDYVKKHDDITYFTNYDIKNNIENVLDYLRKIESPIYITVDIDVLDPSYAPSVGTPAPCGITPFDLEEIIGILSLKESIGLDVVEVSADTIGDSTSINAAQVIYDYLCLKS